jgi:hypothetical protein
MSSILKANALKGLTAGAVIGFFVSILYFGLVILIDTLSNQKHFFELEVIFTIIFACLAVIPATWVGAVTGTVLALLFPIFRHDKTSYIITCFSLCVLIFLGSLTALNPNWLNNIETLNHDNSDYIFMMNLCIMPGVLYSLLSLVMSTLMFNQFQLTELADEKSAENDAAFS